MKWVYWILFTIVLCIAFTIAAHGYDATKHMSQEERYQVLISVGLKARNYTALQYWYLKRRIDRKLSQIGVSI